MAALLGETLLSRVVPSVPASTVLAGKTVALYFSAHWCPPCRRFTTILKKFYDESRGFPFEVIFVSLDQSECEMREYLSLQSNWLFLPFGHPSIKELARRFSVSGLPCIVVVSPSGTIISTTARQQIENRESTEDLLKQWLCVREEEGGEKTVTVTPL